MEPLQLWTIGHSNRTTDEFLSVLAAHGIGAICDVRRFPRSKRHPHFDRPEMEAALHAAGVEYLWLGELLGGYRNYEEHLDTPEFARGVAALVNAGRRAPTAFLCAERDVAQCHRRFIADHLVVRGTAAVTHIVDADRTVPHTVQTELF